MQNGCHDYKTRVANASVRLVRQVLSDRGWRPARLAEELVVHPDLVRRWLRGERRPQLDDMLHMATMVEASLDELLGLRDEEDGVQLAQSQMQQLADLTATSLVRQIALALGGGAAQPAAERTAGAGPMANEARGDLGQKAQEALDSLISIDEAAARIPQRRRA